MKIKIHQELDFGCNEVLQRTIEYDVVEGDTINLRSELDIDSILYHLLKMKFEGFELN